MWHPVFDEMKKEERKQMADFKVRCVKTASDSLVKLNETYQVKDRTFYVEHGDYYADWAEKACNIKSLNEWFEPRGYKFELVEDKPQQFTKADLKTGMRVEIRRGDRLIVFLNTAEDKDVLVGNSWCWLKDYNNELFCCGPFGSHKYDIVKVYDQPVEHIDLVKIHELGKLLWTRPEPKHYTIAEAEAKLAEIDGQAVKIGG